jgi:lipopolysaccharide transport system ATP-binding protein
LIAIAAERVAKSYRQYQESRPRTFQEAVIGGFRQMKRGAYFWSLREVSFTVPRGRALGVIRPSSSWCRASHACSPWVGSMPTPKGCSC